MNEGAVEAAQPAAVVASGNQLTAARLAAGLAIADAARHLKLSPWQVEALETGDYARLPGPVFVRGFIRNYARLLKIDPLPLLAEIAGQIRTEAPAVQAPAASEAIPFPGQQNFNWRPYAIGALVIVAALVGYEFYGDYFAPALVDTSAVELPQAKIISESIPMGTLTTENVQLAPVIATSSAPAAPAMLSPAATTVPPLVPPPAPRTEAVAASAPPAVERSPNDQVIRMMFTRESWVEIRDRQGRIIFSQLNPAGTSQAVSGQPPLRLVVGNASAVRMLFNDRVVDLAPHTQVDVARLTLE